MIRMTGTAARAPTALRASAFRRIAYSWACTLVEVPRNQGRSYGGGQIDVVFLYYGPLKLDSAFGGLLGDD